MVGLFGSECIYGYGVNLLDWDVFFFMGFDVVWMS